MASVNIAVCHADEEFCRQVMAAFQAYDPDLDLTFLTDPQTAVKTIEEEDVNVAVVGVDSPDDPALRQVEALNSSEKRPGLVVVSRTTSQDLLVACLRAGCDEFLEFPIQTDELAKAMGGLYRKLGLTRAGQGKITAVYSAKGGTGATSIACNLAAGVAEMLGDAEACCLLDLNLQFGAAILFLDIREFSYSLADACRDGERLDASLLRSYISHHPSGVNVLPSPLSVEEIDEVDPAKLTSVAQLCRDVYAHVFLDLPHSIDALTIASMDVADQVLLVCDMVLPSIRNTIRALKMFQELDYDNSKFKLVVNRYYDRSQISLQELADHVGQPIYWLVPYDSKVAIAATNSGQTFSAVASGNDISQSLTALSQDIAGISPGPIARKRGLFGWKK